MNKKIFYSIALSASALCMVGCADREMASDSTSYEFSDSIKNLQYLNEYDGLKTYVDRSVNPDFKLAIGVGAQNYVDGKIDCRLANANFDEMTAGNAMKYASCVKDDGSMDFNLVTKFVNAAAANNMTVFGHTLAWHSQQNNKYLNSLLADREIEGGEMADVETELHKQTYTDGKFPFWPMGCEPPVVNGAIHYEPTGAWSQFFIMPANNNKLYPGTYVMYLNITSTKDESVGITVQNGWNGDYQESLDYTVQLEEGQHEVKIPLTGITGVTADKGSEGGEYDVVLKPGTADGTLDVHSVRICQITKSNVHKLTDKEKKDTITWALDRWIDGMMEACDGKVVAWDLANETVSGSDKDGDGILDLQSATRNTVSDEDKKNMFYWQDYMGDLDYVRCAVASARKHFAEHNGDPSQLKLFVNDYNLESFWDDNWKMKSLIEWINRWEADGVTKIDGIASQMHVACSEYEPVQKSREEHIVKMFQLMAKTGKLCKISELDMGYVAAKRDADGNPIGEGDAVKTENMTDAQHKQMADFYQFIVEKYFEIIPAAQRYGITQWCITDAPKDSGWRKGEPVGLWTQSYDRKRAYGGFAEGLKKSNVEGNPNAE